MRAKRGFWVVAVVLVVVLGGVVGGVAVKKAYFTGTTFAQLISLVRAVPVPDGVTLVPPEQHYFSHAGGTGVQREVVRNFQTALPCDDLKRDWERVLQANGRHYKWLTTDHPTELVLQFTDRPVRVGIFFGFPDTDLRCSEPTVGAEGRIDYGPH